MQDDSKLRLEPVTQSLIEHFGEMGSRWGINRTVGQIYALLVFNPDALNSDQIAATLRLSRSNVSMAMKELSAWNLLKSEQKEGDRKTYYTAPEEVWEIARLIVTEKRKREIDPTLSMLRNALIHEVEGEAPTYATKKMREMHDLIEMVVEWTEEMQTLRASRIKRLFQLGSKVNKVLDLASINAKKNK